VEAARRSSAFPRSNRLRGYAEFFGDVASREPGGLANSSTLIWRWELTKQLGLVLGTESCHEVSVTKQLP
jgi:hypothetical protein